MPRVCATCSSPDVVAIDAGLIAGQSAHSLAKLYGLDYDSVLRHRAHGHVAGIVDPAPLPAGAVAPPEPSSPVAQTARAMILQLIEDLEARDQVNADGQSVLGPSAYIALQKEKRLAYESLAKLEGPIGPVKFDPVTSAEWVELREAIFTALEPFPEALEAALSAVRRLLGVAA